MSMKYKIGDFREEIEKLDSIIKEIESESKRLEKKIDEEEIEQNFIKIKSDMSELINMFRMSGLEHISLETGIKTNYFNWNTSLSHGEWAVSGFYVDPSSFAIGNVIPCDVPFKLLHKHMKDWVPDVLKIIMDEWEWVYLNLQKQAFKEIKTNMVKKLHFTVKEYQELEKRQ